MKEILAPSRDYKPYEHDTSLFLAGSIDMGVAVHWQKEVVKRLKDRNVLIFNPRRDDWDSSWEQSPEHAQFNEQVTWELNHIEQADVVFFYFDPKGMAPITLLELGLRLGEAELNHQQIIVCCPDGFWRKGNVQITCSRFNIEVLNDLDDALDTLEELLDEI